MLPGMGSKSFPWPVADLWKKYESPLFDWHSRWIPDMLWRQRNPRQASTTDKAEDDHAFKILREGLFRPLINLKPGQDEERYYEHPGEPVRPDCEVRRAERRRAECFNPFTFQDIEWGTRPLPWHHGEGTRSLQPFQQLDPRKARVGHSHLMVGGGYPTSKQGQMTPPRLEVLGGDFNQATIGPAESRLFYCALDNLGLVAPPVRQRSISKPPWGKADHRK